MHVIEYYICKRSPFGIEINCSLRFVWLTEKILHLQIIVYDINIRFIQQLIYRLFCRWNRHINSLVIPCNTWDKKKIRHKLQVVSNKCATLYQIPSQIYITNWLNHSIQRRSTPPHTHTYTRTLKVWGGNGMLSLSSPLLKHAPISPHFPVHFSASDIMSYWLISRSAYSRTLFEWNTKTSPPELAKPDLKYNTCTCT